MLYSDKQDVYSTPHWKRGRAVEGTGLENRRPERVLEFESLRFRQIRNPDRYAIWVFCFEPVSACVLKRRWNGALASVTRVRR